MEQQASSMRSEAEADREAEGRMRVLVGVTGSVAAIKIPELVQMLMDLQTPKVHAPIL